MAEDVSIQLFGEDIFRRKIRAMRHRSMDMSPVLEEIAEDWSEIIEMAFLYEGKITGKKWPGLKYSTIARRGSAHPILIDSSTMFLELTDPDSLVITDDSITLRLSPEVEARAAAHQHGFHNALTGTDVPARPMVDISDLQRKRFVDKMTDYLTTGEKDGV